jgi:mandelamide amidase
MFEDWSSADALVRARASIASHGAYLSVVDEAGESAGIPFAVKDNIDVAGLPTAAGSPLLAGAVAEADASVVSALRAAGAVVVGRTNMHELAFGVSGNNAAHGPVRNPADPARTAGGSSGGSALAVALGTVPFSLGTDTGGSVTIPASFCGVVGFRPTTGRYPGDGVVNLSSTRDTIGVHAARVADVRVVDRVITGEADAPAPAGLTIGVPRSRYEGVAREIEPVVQAALDRLAAAGVTLVDLDIPDDLEIGGGAGLNLVFYEAERLISARVAALRGPGFGFAEMAGLIVSPDVRGIAEIIAATPLPPDAYEQARRARWALRRAYVEAFTGVDAIIGPSCPVLPPMLGNDDTAELNGVEVPLFATVTRNAAPGTTAGVPMLSVPAGRTAAGLPVGLSLEGRFFDDVRLLAIGEVLEAHLR